MVVVQARQAGLALLEEFGDHDDFGSLELAGRGVVLRWRGPQPERLEQALAQLTGEDPELVRVLPCAYGAAELRAEGTRIVLRFSQVFPFVHQAGASRDGNAIDLVVLPGMLARIEEGGVPLEVLLGTDYPVRAVEGGMATPA